MVNYSFTKFKIIRNKINVIIVFMESIKITDSKLNMAITINEIFCVIGNVCLANYVISKSVQEFVRNFAKRRAKTVE